MVDADEMVVGVEDSREARGHERVGSDQESGQSTHESGEKAEGETEPADCEETVSGAEDDEDECEEGTGDNNENPTTVQTLDETIEDLDIEGAHAVSPPGLHSLDSCEESSGDTVDTVLMVASFIMFHSRYMKLSDFPGVAKFLAALQCKDAKEEDASCVLSVCCELANLLLADDEGKFESSSEWLIRWGKIPSSEWEWTEEDEKGSPEKSLMDACWNAYQAREVQSFFDLDLPTRLDVLRKLVEAAAESQKVRDCQDQIDNLKSGLLATKGQLFKLLHEIETEPVTPQTNVKRSLRSHNKEQVRVEALPTTSPKHALQTPLKAGLFEDGSKTTRPEVLKKIREVKKRIQRASELRQDPLGSDRHHSVYWAFDACPEDALRVYVQRDGSKWGFYESREEIQTLMDWLDDRGEREIKLLKNIQWHCKQVISPAAQEMAKELQKKEKEEKEHARDQHRRDKEERERMRKQLAEEKLKLREQEQQEKARAKEAKTQERERKATEKLQKAKEKEEIARKKAEEHEGKVVKGAQASMESVSSGKKSQSSAATNKAKSSKKSKAAADADASDSEDLDVPLCAKPAEGKSDNMDVEETIVVRSGRGKAGKSSQEDAQKLAKAAKAKPSVSAGDISSPVNQKSVRVRLSGSRSSALPQVENSDSDDVDMPLVKRSSTAISPTVEDSVEQTVAKDNAMDDGGKNISTKRRERKPAEGEMGANEYVEGQIPDNSTSVKSADTAGGRKESASNQATKRKNETEGHEEVEDNNVTTGGNADIPAIENDVGVERGRKQRLNSGAAKELKKHEADSEDRDLTANSAEVTEKGRKSSRGVKKVKADVGRQKDSDEEDVSLAAKRSNIILQKVEKSSFEQSSPADDVSSTKVTGRNARPASRPARKAEEEKTTKNPVSNTLAAEMDESSAPTSVDPTAESAVPLVENSSTGKIEVVQEDEKDVKPDVEMTDAAEATTSSGEQTTERESPVKEAKKAVIGRPSRQVKKPSRYDSSDQNEKEDSDSDEEDVPLALRSGSTASKTGKSAEKNVSSKKGNDCKVTRPAKKIKKGEDVDKTLAEGSGEIEDETGSIGKKKNKAHASNDAHAEVDEEGSKNKKAKSKKTSKSTERLSGNQGADSSVDPDEAVEEESISTGAKKREQTEKVAAEKVPVKGQKKSARAGEQATKKTEKSKKKLDSSAGSDEGFLSLPSAVIELFKPDQKTRSGLLKAAWKYVNDNNLFDADDRNYFLPDERVKGLLQCKSRLKIKKFSKILAHRYASPTKGDDNTDSPDKALSSPRTSASAPEGTDLNKTLVLNENDEVRNQDAKSTGKGSSEGKVAVGDAPKVAAKPHYHKQGNHATRTYGKRKREAETEESDDDGAQNHDHDAKTEVSNAKEHDCTVESTKQKDLPESEYQKTTVECSKNDSKEHKSAVISTKKKSPTESEVSDDDDECLLAPALKSPPPKIAQPHRQAADENKKTVENDESDDDDDEPLLWGAVAVCGGETSKEGDANKKPGADAAEVKAGEVEVVISNVTDIDAGTQPKNREAVEEAAGAVVNQDGMDVEVEHRVDADTDEGKVVDEKPSVAFAEEITKSAPMDQDDESMTDIVKQKETLSSLEPDTVCADRAGGEPVEVSEQHPESRDEGGGQPSRDEVGESNIGAGSKRKTQGDADMEELNDQENVLWPRRVRTKTILVEESDDETSDGSDSQTSPIKSGTEFLDSIASARPSTASKPNKHSSVPVGKMIFDDDALTGLSDERLKTCRKRGIVLDDVELVRELCIAARVAWKQDHVSFVGRRVRFMMQDSADGTLKVQDLENGRVTWLNAQCICPQSVVTHDQHQNTSAVDAIDSSSQVCVPGTQDSEMVGDSLVEDFVEGTQNAQTQEYVPGTQNEQTQEYVAEGTQNEQTQEYVGVESLAMTEEYFFNTQEEMSTQTLAESVVEASKCGEGEHVENEGKNENTSLQTDVGDTASKQPGENASAQMPACDDDHDTLEADGEVDSSQITAGDRVDAEEDASVQTTAKDLQGGAVVEDAGKYPSAQATGMDVEKGKGDCQTELIVPSCVRKPSFQIEEDDELDDVDLDQLEAMEKEVENPKQKLCMDFDDDDDLDVDLLAQMEQDNFCA